MKLNLFCVIVYIVFGLLLVIGIKPKRCENAGQFGERINSFRGVMALEIIIGHCVRNESNLLAPFGHFMLVGVGYFFFVSGFGLAKSYATKENYLKTFLVKRWLRLLYVMLIGLIVTTVIANISQCKTVLASLPMKPLLLLKEFVVRTNWYLRELFILYVLFFLIYRFCSKRKSSLLLLTTIALCIVLGALGYTRCWYASTLCFPMGIIVYENYDLLINRLCSVKGYLMTLVLFTVGLSEMFWGGKLTHLTFTQSEYIVGVSNNILCIGVVLLLIAFCFAFDSGNIVCEKLTAISTEMYITQFVLVFLAEATEMNAAVKILFVVTIDILVSVIIHPLLKIGKHRNKKTNIKETA